MNAEFSKCDFQSLYLYREGEVRESERIAWDHLFPSGLFFSFAKVMK